MDDVQVGDRTIGPNVPVFTIAEAGVNHNGDVDLAHRLVDLAREVGADAVKFQTFDPEALVGAQAQTAPYQQAKTGSSSQLEMLRGLTLPRPAYEDLAAHARQAGLLFLSTPFDAGSADLLEKLDVPAFKVPSGELDNLPFLEEIASRGRPVLLSTGMGTLEEVRTALAHLSGAPSVCLFHCVSAYPTPIGHANIRAIATMRDAFGVPVGWSDHTEDEYAGGLAVAAGAVLVEKHLTTDRGLPGPDHAASLDGEGFGRYVELIRRAEQMRGDGVKRPAPVEEENRQVVRRSLHANRDLPAGHVLLEADVVRIRPATGLPASVRAEGLILSRQVNAGQPITPEDVQP